MPSKISYQTWSGGSGRGDPQELIGFCKESPVEVLRKVFQNHYINHYEIIYRPVDRSPPNNHSGLLIIDGEAPAGTKITGSLKDLDLERAKARLASPRTALTYVTALKEAIIFHLGAYCVEDPRNYLDAREEKTIKHMEIYIPPLLQIAQVTLGIENPTVKDLKIILTEK